MTRTSLLLLATLLAAGTLQAQTQPQAPGGEDDPGRACEGESLPNRNEAALCGEDRPGC